MQKNALIDTYCVKGVPDFAVSDRIDILDRASTLGEALYNCYTQYQATNEKTIFRTLNEIIANSQTLKLNSQDYIDCFLSFGGKVNKAYLSFIEQLSAGE